MNNTAHGWWAAIGAYSIWGVMPVYFKLLEGTAADAILVHRVLWSVLLLALLSLWHKQLSALRLLFRQPRQLLLLCASAVLIACNWLIYVWAIHADRLLEVSLGYYINPLLLIALGALVLGERLNRRQYLAILFAACGVAIPLFSIGQLPWVALSLAATFGLYGLLRKLVQIDSISALLVETSLLLPLVLAYGWWAEIFPAGQWQASSLDQQLMLIGVGVITAVPLLLFGRATRTLRLSTLGFFQYIGPSTTFLLAWLLYDEPLQPQRLFTFLLVWLGLALITIDLWRQHRHSRR